MDDYGTPLSGPCRAEAALPDLIHWASELLRGWDAKKKLSAGFGGMGVNILQEDVGRLTSIMSWERLRKAIDNARAALLDTAPEKGER